MKKGRIHLCFACINAIIANHFEMLFGDVANQALHKIQNGKGFGNELIILMPVVMECDEVPIIAVNTGSGDCRTAKIAADIFGNSFGIAFTGFCVNIESVGMVVIGTGFLFAERIAKNSLKFVEQDGLERIT